MKNVISLLSLIIAFSLCFPAEAQAYIDPGTGSLILQGLAAAFVSLMVFWRGLREKIKNFFLRKPAESASGKKQDTE
jgi:hypothetical protein